MGKNFTHKDISLLPVNDISDETKEPGRSENIKPYKTISQLRNVRRISAKKWKAAIKK